LAQCREWLNRNLPGAEREAVSSNAEAVRLAAAEPGAAAIAGETAAAVYGVPVLQANIEDDPSNTTRFLILGSQVVESTGHDRTSLLVSARNRAGALHDLLQPLADHGISMTRIESRPSRNAVWEYVFFVDIEGHAADPAVATALAELEQAAALFKVLGSYPLAQV